MKKKQSSKQTPLSLRRCVSNQHLFMQIIPEFSTEPYFVRKKLEEACFPRGSSLTSRKNKLIDAKKNQSSKQKPVPLDRNSFKIFGKEENKNRKFNSPIKSEKQFLELKKNTTNIQMTETVSELNLSDDKVSTSGKSVKFSNRLEDNKSGNKRRQGSRTPSILKTKNRKYGAGSGISSIASERSFSVNQSFRSNEKQIKKKFIEESNTNNIIKKKYETILKTLELNSKKPPLPGRRFLKIQSTPRQKFQDQIFPPFLSSVFPFNPKTDKNEIRKGKEIEWKRISQLFPNQKLALYDKPDQIPKYFDSSKEQTKVAKITIFREIGSYASENIVTALNAIKNNEELLGKIFQNQQVNDYGIYLLKIFQENQWKYIIIDDFIPVVRSNLSNTQNLYIPAFINVRPQVSEKGKKVKKKASSEEILPIWPFLIEKAYANYYSSYEALTYGNTIDMVQQFCGISSQKLSLVEKTDAEEYLEIIDKLLLGLKNGNVVVLGQLKQTLPMIPLHYKAEYCYSMITEEELIYYDPNQQYRPCKIKFYDLGLICTHLFIFTPLKFLQEVNCVISKPKHKVSPHLITKINKEENIVPRDIPTIRKFILKYSCECLIFIRQKEKRRLYRLGIEYIWLRVFLIGKDYDGTYKWIDAEYSNKKTISFNHFLEAGEYFMFFYPEWSKEKYHHQIYATVFSNEPMEPLERIIFDSKLKMLEESCTDLAQKKGKLNQINKFICSYNYVDKKAAIVVENIHNERLSGEVNIVRSILGLKCAVEIVPINDEFYDDLKNKKNQAGAEYLAVKKNSIDVKIQKGESFTVILKMRGGIDPKFFKAFTFGT